MPGLVSIQTGALQDLSAAAGANPRAVVRQAPRTSRTAPELQPAKAAGEDLSPDAAAQSNPARDMLISRMVERARSAVLGNDTSISFERNDDGRIYLYVRDKYTGEELCRIPKNYLENSDPSAPSNSRLDVRI